MPDHHIIFATVATVGPLLRSTPVAPSGPIWPFLIPIAFGVGILVGLWLAGRNAGSSPGGGGSRGGAPPPAPPPPPLSHARRDRPCSSVLDPLDHPRHQITRMGSTVIRTSRSGSPPAAVTSSAAGREPEVTRTLPADGHGHLGRERRQGVDLGAPRAESVARGELRPRPAPLRSRGPAGRALDRELDEEATGRHPRERDAPRVHRVAGEEPGVLPSEPRRRQGERR